MPSSDLLLQAWSPIVEFAVGCLLRLHIVLHTLVGNLPLDALEGVIQSPSAAIGVMVHAAALHTYLEISYLEISYLELGHLAKCSSLASNEFQDQFDNFKIIFKINVALRIWLEIVILMGHFFLFKFSSKPLFNFGANFPSIFGRTWLRSQNFQNNLGSNMNKCFQRKCPW